VADSAVSSLTAGFVEAQRQVVRREEAFRREFVDDLLTGGSDVGTLVDSASGVDAWLRHPGSRPDAHIGDDRKG
jgi:hypothetical protein